MSNTIYPLDSVIIRFLSDTEVLNEWGLCAVNSDSIVLVVDKGIAMNSIYFKFCDKDVYSVIDTRSVNRRNPKANDNEIYMYRIDVNRNKYIVYFMRPFNMTTRKYTFRIKKGKAHILNSEQGIF